MLAEELTARLKLEAAYQAAKEEAKKKKTTPAGSGSKNEMNGNEADPSLCEKCHFAHILCECEEEEEDDDEDEEADVTQEEWDDALKLIFEALDSLDRVVEDDRVHLPEGMKFLLMSRRIDVWDFLSQHATPEQIAEYQGESDIHRSDK